jgi:hypothetical protein
MHKNWRVWMALAAFAVLVSFAARLSSVIEDVELEAFMGQWIEKVRTFDMIMDEVDDYVRIDQDWGRYNYVEHLNPTVMEMDNERGVFAALYSDELELLSRRYVVPNETPLDPLTNLDLVAAVSAFDRGNFILPFPTNNERYNWARVYYRWIPTGKQYDDKLLAVIAMWPGAMDAHPTDKLTSWCIGLLALALVEIIMVALALPSRPQGRGKAGEAE